jgi:hypothetical protein
MTSAGISLSSILFVSREIAADFLATIFFEVVSRCSKATYAITSEGYVRKDTRIINFVSMLRAGCTVDASTFDNALQVIISHVASKTYQGRVLV